MTFSMNMTGGFVGVSSILHLAGAVLSGFSPQGLTLLPIFIAYLLLAWGLHRESRLLAFLTFFVMLIGSIAALLGSYDATSNVPSWVSLAILCANVLAGITLFFILWRDPPAAGSPMPPV